VSETGGLLNRSLHDAPDLPTDVRKLYKRVSAIEGQIQDSLLINAARYIAERGLSLKGDIIAWSDNLTLQFAMEPCSQTGVYRLYFIPRGVTRSQLITHSASIQEVGRVKTISIEWPAMVARRLPKLLDVLRDQLEFQYRLVEQHFLEMYRESSAQIFLGIHRIIRVELCRHHLEHLYAQLTLTVSRKSSLRFRYYLDYEGVKAILERFKQNPPFGRYSALDLTLALVFSEADHTINKLFQDYTPGKALHLPTSKFLSAQENVPFFIAESALFDNSQLSEFTVCDHDPHVFQIGFPSSYEDTLLPVLKDIRPALEKVFLTNMGVHKRFLRYFRAEAGSSIFETAGRFFGSMMAAFIKEIGQ
jgi:hypothetical protein